MLKVEIFRSASADDLQEFINNWIMDSEFVMADLYKILQSSSSGSTTISIWYDDGEDA